MNKRKLRLLHLLIACGVVSLANVGKASAFVDSLDKTELDAIISHLEENPIKPDTLPDNPFYGQTNSYDA